MWHNGKLRIQNLKLEKYIFHLGRLSTLSLAELVHIFGENNIEDSNPKYALLNIKDSFSMNDAQICLDKIGGTLKISQIISELRDTNDIIINSINFLMKKYKKDEKVIFGINKLLFRTNLGISVVKLLNDIKKALQKEGLIARFINKNGQNIPAAVFFKEKIYLEKAYELNIVEVNNKIYLTQTLAVQDIDAYSIRDYDKPFRDAKTGMLPPKLAQIMINIALSSNNSIIDPFCGSGTVLMEALLMGKNVIGSDISEKQAEGAELNLRWLCEKFKIFNQKWEIYLEDSRNFYVDKETAKQSTVVTEGYLGPPQSKLPTPNEINQIENIILNIHSEFLLNANNCEITKIILCLPAFKDRTHTVLLTNFDKMLGQTGYKIIPTFSKNFIQKYPFVYLSKRNTLIYNRDDQIVGREILILEKCA